MASAHPHPRIARPTWVATRWYFFSVILILSAHVLIVRYNGLLGPAAYTIFIGAVVISAFSGGYGPSLLATTLASVDLLYTFLKPYHSFQVDFGNFVFLCVFLVVALLTSTLQVRRLRAEESLQQAHDELEARVRDRTAELALSQAQLSLLVNGIAEQAFFTLDEAGRVSSWNQGAEHLLGYGMSDIVGQPVSKLVPGITLGATKSAPHTSRSEEQEWAAQSRKPS